MATESNQRKNRLNLRLNDKERAAIARAAKSCEKAPGTYARERLLHLADGDMGRSHHGQA